MVRKRYSAEEIVAKLRQVDVMIAMGRSFVEALDVVGVPKNAYARWQSEYGGLTRTLRPSREATASRPKLRQPR
jgi:putative transposase